MLHKLVRSLVPGITMHSAIEASRRLNAQKIATTIDILLEGSRNRLEATGNTKEYIDLLDGIRRSKVNANISIKLTTLGLLIDEDLCRKNVESIARAAGKTVVIIDMEEYARHEATMRLFFRIHKKYKNVWIAVQAYLHDSAQDTSLLIKQRASIRLVKGVYNESARVAFQTKNHIDDRFMEIEAMMLKSGLSYAIASHDEKIIEFIKYTTRKQHSKRIEFQLLYGVKPWLAEEIALEGFKVRVYVPYGKKWFGYVVRRLRESRM